MQLVWHSLVTNQPLKLNLTLSSGQCFRWIKTDTNVWTSVMDGQLVHLKQSLNQILFACPSSNDPQRIHDKLFNYFQLNVDLKSLFESWSSKDPIFKEKCVGFEGLRVLKQEPIETALTFICTSNNNIKRITYMVYNLCKVYGEFVDIYQGHEFYTFPHVSILAQEGVEDRLRKIGFGYRAKYIAKTAQQIMENKDSSTFGLQELVGQEYSIVKNELLRYPGIGPKVADCVALFSMDCTGAIPVDTHVWSIAIRDYKIAGLKTKSLTDKTYQLIGDVFREKFGEYAGWAHSVLFAADLKDLQAIVSESVDECIKEE